MGAHLILQLYTLHALLLVCSSGSFILILMLFPLPFSSAMAALAGQYMFPFYDMCWGGGSVSRVLSMHEALGSGSDGIKWERERV